MRCSFLSFVLISFLSGFSAFAQRAEKTPAARPASSTLALAAEPAAPSTAPAAAPRLACTKLNGQVVGLDGRPLVGATVTLKGTPHLYITNSEGRYLVEVPVYQGQVLEVEAAGYTTREISLSDCTAPVVGLELAEGTKVKKKGKRAGQIVRFGTADLQ